MTSSDFPKALSAFLIMLSLLGCKEEPQRQVLPVDKPASLPRVRSNAIYHWKTIFDLKAEETDFISTHSVRKMYVRYFDVDVETSPMNATYSAIPIATTVFKSPKPTGVEIAPTVFITVKALIATKEDGIKDLASKIYTRVLNMSDYNDMGQIREIQLDCDWTGSTQELFYALCRETVRLAHTDSIQVSATIRLHQLKMDPPPVDQGVLMVYNTGALRETRTRNSILDYDDVKTYLSGKTIRYGLPLDFAFPTYGWGVMFRNGSYNGILHKTDFSDETRYKIGKEGTFIVKKDHMVEGRSLWEGDVIRMEYPTAEDVIKVAELVTASVKDSTHSVILYHLDPNNLIKFTDNEISSIYSY